MLRSEGLGGGCLGHAHRNTYAANGHRLEAILETVVVEIVRRTDTELLEFAIRTRRNRWSTACVPYGLIVTTMTDDD